MCVCCVCAVSWSVLCAVSLCCVSLCRVLEFQCVEDKNGKLLFAGVNMYARDKSNETLQAMVMPVVMSVNCMS